MWEAVSDLETMLAFDPLPHLLHFLLDGPEVEFPIGSFVLFHEGGKRTESVALSFACGHCSRSGPGSVVFQWS
jgi:hypothetical protein